MFDGLQLRIFLATALSAGLAACGPPTHDAWNQSYEVSGPVETDGRLIYLNESLEKLHILEPSRRGGDVDLSVEKVPTGPEPDRMKLSANDEQLYVLNEGDETLDVYDLTADPPTRNTVQLESAYNHITVDPEGNFVLLSFIGGTPSDCIACNPHEVGVVDLRNGVPERAEFVTLPKRAVDLVFAPTFTAGGNNQRLVAALSPSQVSLIDLQTLLSENGAEKDEVRKVPLTISQADDVLEPKQAVFHVGSGKDQTVALYLLTRRGSDVTQVSIQANTRKDADRKFDLSVNQLAAGTSPTAVTVLELPDAGTRLLALDSSGARFHLIDVQSGEGSSFQLPITAAPTDMLVYKTVVSTEKGDETETRVLAWSNQSSVVAVIRPASIAIADDNPTVGRSVTAIRLDAAPQAVRWDDTGDRKRAIAVHGGANAGFSVLNLRAAEGETEAIAIQGASLSDVEFAGPAAWGVFQGKPNFGKFELETGHPTVYELPEPGQNILYDGSDNVVLVDHGKDHGEFSVVDANEPSPDNARVFQGLFLRGLLQESFPKSD